MDGLEKVWDSGRRASRNLGRSMSRSLRNFEADDVFSLSNSASRRSNMSRRGRVDEDEEALRWAALEKLPTYDRLRKGILKSMVDGDGGTSRPNFVHKEVDVRNLGDDQRQEFIQSLLKIADEDNERFLRKLRNRVEKVGITLPTVEVRFQNLNIEAKCFVGGRSLPTLLNTTLNIAEALIETSGIHLGNSTKLTILNNASGIIKPSRMTLLLGPPSSGKSTLLLALAGKLEESLKVKGDITYNGHGLKEFVPQKTSAYISQNDVHYGEMTVKETLDFSGRCQGIGSRYDLLSELSRREKEAGILPEAEVDLYMKATSMEGLESSLATDYTLRILGLDICSDTIVGDEMQRGISGGQKKRVTTGEMIVGPTNVLLMDEISTGLDSSTTFQIIKCLQQIVHLGEATIVISLLQPAPETYELFDDVILLSEGQVVYQGPRENILEFFEFCGFRCPERKGAADFLQEVTSRKDQSQYWFDRNTSYNYVPVSEFVKKFEKFHVGASLKQELSVPFDKSTSHQASLIYTKKSVPTSDLLRACFAREYLLIRRNSFVYLFKTIQIIIMAFIGSTVFLRTTLDINVSDASLYNGALVFGVVMNMFNGMPDMSFLIQSLPVFYKQRDLLFFPAWMFSLAKFVLTLPMSVLESIAWTVTSYYTIGFAPEASRFFKQLLSTFLLQQVAASSFRSIGAICRNVIVSNTGGSLVLMVFLILAGFFLPYNLIPVWWQWAHWCSPLGYAFKAQATNEFLAPRWDVPINNDETTIGKQTLDNLDVPTDPNWYWIGIGSLLGFIVFFNFLFTLCLTFLNPIGGKSSTISENEATEMEATQEDSKETPRITIQRSRREMAQHNLSLANSDGNNTREMLDRRLGSRSNTDNSNNNGGVPIAKKGMVLPFTPLAMSFDDVNYFVDMPGEMKDQGVTEDRLQLLRGVTGAFRPGVLTALMGVSGAGKTTLMDVLAGRKTGGYIEGDVKISGYTKNQDTFARISGYCEQNDIHSPSVTVKESLIYSAFLRLPKEVNDDQKMVFVDQVIELVELENLKDAIVGLPGISGLSTEQRKRLTIAVELVANPSVIFMDEPTSGLDARAAAIVMRTVRNTVDTGRTVVCTIHQPSIEIFEAFDELLLMKRGGQIIYFGPLGQHSKDIVNYFEAVPGVIKIKEKLNPATWMLDASSGAQEVRLGIDFADHYTNSNLFKRNQDIVKELSIPPPGSSDLHFPSKFSQTMWGQFKLCLWKQWWTYWRSPEYNLVRFFFTFLCAVLFGSIFWDVASNSDTSSKLQIIIGALYSSVFFLGVNNCGGVQPIVSTERAVFYREKAAGMYSALPYAIGQMLVEIPYILVQTIQFSFIIYAMVGFEWTAAKFLWFFYVTFLSFLYFAYYGMMTVSISPNLQIASILAASFYALFNLFSGFFIPRPKIPKWWIWYYWICPIAWTVYGLIVSQFGDREDLIEISGLNNKKPIKQFLKDDYGYEEDFIGVVAVVMFAWPVFFALIYSLCIKHLNFQSR